MSTAQTPSVDVETFAVDGQFLMVLPRAGASFKNPDIQLPILRSDEDGYYLEMRVDADAEDMADVAVTRQVPLEGLSAYEWAEVQKQYASLDISVCHALGLSKGLETLQDRRLERLMAALLTFLNPRQVSIVLYLYRLAAQQGHGPVVSFRSNSLLEALGYKRTKDGGFASKLRSQLHRDLVSLHRTELIFAQSLPKEDTLGAKVTIKSVLRIKDYEIDNVPRNFDLAKAADYTYELADAYTISLEFFDGPAGTGDSVLFADSLDIRQRLGESTQHNYKIKLLTYLASRMRWDKPEDGQYLSISKRYLFKNLDLLGRNASRNNQLFWRTVEELREEGYIVSAQEMPGKQKSTTVQFQINSDKLRPKANNTESSINGVQRKTKGALRPEQVVVNGGTTEVEGGQGVGTQV